ncbi:MAG: hypothetical protein J2P17_25615 [Mycobacterium sp.]|nr:hypothetical protein [Mycobacterium sp.]
MWLNRAGIKLAAVLAACTVGVAIQTTSYASTVTVGSPCRFIELPSIAEGSVIVVAGDHSGNYQIGVRTLWDAQGNLQEDLIVWHNGALHLGARLSDVAADPRAVNSHGVVVGSRQSADHTQAFALVYGQFVALAAPSGASAEAVAINDAGEVAGGLVNEWGFMQRALRWSADGTVSELATPSGFSFAQATSIDDDGTVLGIVTNDPAMYTDARLVVWLPNGQVRLLPGSASAGSDARFWPVGIREGQVTGMAYSRAATVTLRWNARSGDPTVISTGDAASVNAVNARGSLLLSGGAVDGIGLLQGDVVRPLYDGAESIGPVALTDDDVVYGKLSSALPGYADCRV